jgi:hypothetical protein
VRPPGGGLPGGGGEKVGGSKDGQAGYWQPWGWSCCSRRSTGFRVKQIYVGLDSLPCGQVVHLLWVSVSPSVKWR